MRQLRIRPRRVQEDEEALKPDNFRHFWRSYLYLFFPPAFFFSSLRGAASSSPSEALGENKRAGVKREKPRAGCVCHGPYWHVAIPQHPIRPGNGNK